MMEDKQRLVVVIDLLREAENVVCYGKELGGETGGLYMSSSLCT